MLSSHVTKMGYTIKQKIDICLMSESNPDMTQADLANWAKKKYGTSKPPSQTTISRILSKKDELIALKEHEFRLIRRRKPSNVLLRKILQEWIFQSVWDTFPITIPIIQNSATSLWKILPANSREGNGEFSHKWCNHFLGKMNVNLNNIENELIKPLKIWSFSEKDLLKNFLKQFKKSDIFTLDEFFLYFQLPLDKKLTYSNPSASSPSNALTIMLASNSDGSEKLEPLIVGHYENMACFDGKPPVKITNKYGVTYKSNKKAWLTSTMFYDWLAVLDKRLSITNRHIIIVIDTAGSHRVPILSPTTKQQ
ncbi:DDE-domain-containing protein [Ascoidea rubescens DSM 1968]|uniref:DDE-domain-containing protein n=1 Tax=Ascoidea rubescens DSM 1968 TaxID=1344418 RepID=A0A1D2VQ67_9ASCO|nr:DDE-domain-containing protein [Ascoidea rubescens DSM 1968]ODV63763.1 DDE-domain-containing protein [Ascoidea rubescens DSM 1968]